VNFTEAAKAVVENMVTAKAMLMAPAARRRVFISNQFLSKYIF